MRILFSLLASAFTITVCYAQKPPIDYNAIQNWPQITSETISSDGNYIIYSIVSGSSRTLVISSVDKSFQREVSSVPQNTNASFTNDASNAIFMKQHDTLCILNLNTKTESNIPNCTSFKIPLEGTGPYLAYQTFTGDVTLYNSKSKKSKTFAECKDYIFSNSGNALVVQKTWEHHNTLKWINPLTGTEIPIWQGGIASGFVFSPRQDELAFFGKDSLNDIAGYSIWVYNSTTDRIIPYVNNSTLPKQERFIIKSSGLRFSTDEDKLFFQVSKKPLNQSSEATKIKLKIWGYNDKYILPEQESKLKTENSRSFLAVMHLTTKKVLVLEQEDDATSYGKYNFNSGDNDNYVLIDQNLESDGYDSTRGKNIYLVNTNDGSRILLTENSDFRVRFSEGGKYIYWYDRLKRTLFTFNILSKKVIPVSNRLPHNITEDFVRSTSQLVFNTGFAIWMDGDSSILVYDKYDIWRLDPNGKRPAFNVTNGFGRENNLVLRVIGKDNLIRKSIMPIEANTSLILAAFSEKTRENGFFKKEIGSIGNPTKLIMDSSIFYYPESINFVGFSTNFLQKAEGANVYLLKRRSTNQYPNLFITKDFKNFASISNLQPQAKYNWMTSELIKWKTFDGHLSDGILFKPEDFNPQKKYPIIFYFYETLSDGLHAFVNPELSNGPLNIAFYISHGYLVFCPDIKYTIGQPGESAYNYIVSAAETLAKKSWVDKSHMGIQGHSWGGYEVDYLVGRTGIFAAAVSAAGINDLISGYLTITRGGVIGEPYSQYERGQVRLGTTLWQNPSVFINNSPLFRANKINTPLLMMHNDKDGAVPWSQGIEFYLALRRLKKPVWMLQYEGQDHVLFTDDLKLDYSIRMNQFFDHYLKGAPAPTWLTNGIPVDRIGMKTAYQFDPAGNCGKNCKICKYWNEKFKKDSAACWKEIEEKTKSEHWMGGGENK